MNPQENQGDDHEGKGHPERYPETGKTRSPPRLCLHLSSDRALESVAAPASKRRPPQPASSFSCGVGWPRWPCTSSTTTSYTPARDFRRRASGQWVVPFLVIVAAGFLLLRMRAGLSAVIAMVFGVLALVAGAEATYYLTHGGISDDYTGLLSIFARGASSRSRHQRVVEVPTHAGQAGLALPSAAAARRAGRRRRLGPAVPHRSRLCGHPRGPG
jgi:hypothetical protein